MINIYKTILIATICCIGTAQVVAVAQYHCSGNDPSCGNSYTSPVRQADLQVVEDASNMGSITDAEAVDLRADLRQGKVNTVKEKVGAYNNIFAAEQAEAITDADVTDLKYYVRTGTKSIATVNTMVNSYVEIKDALDQDQISDTDASLFRDKTRTVRSPQYVRNALVQYRNADEDLRKDLRRALEGL